MDDALGDIGKGDAGLLRRDRAGQDARADQEQAFLPEQPQPVEKFFVGIRVRQRRREPRRQFALVRHRAEEARIDQPVHDLRLPRQHVAETRRCAQHQRHQRDEVAVLAQQRNQPPAALQRSAGSDRTPSPHCRVLRHGPGRRSAPARTRQRRCGSIPAGTRGSSPLDPLPHGVGHQQRLLEAERRQMLDQARIVRAGAVIHRRQFAVPAGSPSNSLP